MLPLALGAVGVLAGSDLATQLALIWLAHIGADRALGYGLKYPSKCRGHAPPARLTRGDPSIE